jgi:hypothetical protein
MSIEQKLDQIISILLKIEENTRPNHKAIKPVTTKNTKKVTQRERVQALADRLDHNSKKQAKSFISQLANESKSSRKGRTG